MNTCRTVANFLLIGLCLFACRNSAFTRNDKAKKGKTEDASKEKVADRETKAPLPIPFPVPSSENVDPPSNVAGTLLTCAYEVVPDPARNDSLMGCRLSDKDGKKVKVASDVQYSFTAVNALEVKMRKLSNDNRYDVLYLVRGVKDIAESSAITVKVDQAGQIFQEKKAADVIVAGNKLPEAHLFDYGKARDQMLAADGTDPLVLERLPSDPLSLGNRHYVLHCQSCHGVAKQDPAKNIKVNNRDTIVGTLSSEPAMKSLEGVLTLEDITAISNFLQAP